MRITFYTSCFLLLFLSGFILVSAQEKKEPTQREVKVPAENEAPLPKIDLPEFLITGQETIDLPVTNKTPVEEEKVYVPGSPSAGNKPKSNAEGAGRQVKLMSEPGGQMNGKVLAGIGNYGTPLLEGWFGKSYSEGSVLFHADYTSTAGHVTNANTQRMGVEVTGNYLSPASFGFIAGSRLSGGIGFRGESYRAYGSLKPTQVRSLNDIRIAAGTSSRIPAGKLLTDAVDYSAKISWMGLSVSDSSTASENEFGISCSAASQIGLIHMKTGIDYVGSAVSNTITSAHSPQWFVFNAAGSIMLAQSLKGEFSLSQYLYRGNISAAHGRFAPSLDLRWFADDEFTLFASAGFGVERNTLRSLLKENRYLISSSMLEPSVVPFQCSGGAEAALNQRFRVRGTAAYKLFDNYPTFWDRMNAKVWEVVYLSDVREVLADLQASYRITDRSAVTMTAGVNSTTQKDSSRSMPFIPVFTSGLLYQQNFIIGITVEGTIEFVSSRYTDFLHQHSSPAYVLLGIKGEYEFIQNLRGIVQCTNLLNQKYIIWDGYRERTFFVSFSLTYKW